MTELVASSGCLSRRRAIQLMVLVAAGSGTLDASGNTAGPTGLGYGTDPELKSPPEDLWPLVTDDHHRRVLSHLVDTILPARGESPAASTLGLVAFFEEWLSAPYPSQQEDRELILPFLEAVAGGRPAATDSPAWERVRQLTAAAYYTTPIGMAEMGYVGNYPQREFKGPPEDALALLDARYQALNEYPL